ncbi:MAG: sigma-70 family RNA polymerase sigma factor [Planctomycetota bacterium]
MDPIDDRLSRIETSWSIVRQAHDAADDSASARDVVRAQQDLLDRYGGAVKRYALAALRDEEAADDVFQEFALRFVRGDLGRANPDKGRFRSFVKTTVYHLIVDHQRRGKREARMTPIRTATPEPRAPTEEQHAELFSATWRDDLLARVWQLLEASEGETGKPYYTALRCRVDNPDLRSPELAEKLSLLLGKPMKAGAARVLLHRAREAFAELLLEEVAHTLPGATRDELQEELIDLNLFEYCRPIFEKQAAEADRGAE